MKIAYIYTALTSFGGVDRILTIKANYFAEQLGYEVYIITNSQAGRPPVFPLSPKVRHIDLDTDFDEQYHYGIIKRYFCYRRLMKQYRQRLETALYEIKPDIVLTTCGRDLDFLTEIKDGSKKIGESHIAKQYCRNFHLMEAKGGIYKIVAKYWRRKQEKSIAKLDALVVLTNHDAESWNKVKKATVIPNPISITATNISTCTNKRIISVGRLSEQKGFDMLIEAWEIVARKHTDWTLEIYGEGELKKELEGLISKKNLNATLHLCGKTKDIAEKYAESSIYVMSSRFEGFGLVLVEAMSSGMPCVSFDCPHGPSDIIRNNEDGILVENGNIKKLAESIIYLIENESERTRMGKQAIMSSQRYCTQKIMQKWAELFKKLKNKEI